MPNENELNYSVVFPPDEEFIEDYMKVVGKGELAVIKDEARKVLNAIEPLKQLVKIESNNKILFGPAFKITQESNAFLPFATVVEYNEAHKPSTHDAMPEYITTITDANRELKKIVQEIFDQVKLDPAFDEKDRKSVLEYISKKVMLMAPFFMPQIKISLANELKEQAGRLEDIPETFSKYNVDALINAKRREYDRDYIKELNRVTKAANKTPTELQNELDADAAFESAKDVQIKIQRQVEAIYKHLSPREQHSLAYYIFDLLYNGTASGYTSFRPTQKDVNIYTDIRDGLLYHNVFDAPADFAAAHPEIVTLIHKIIKGEDTEQRGMFIPSEIAGQTYYPKQTLAEKKAIEEANATEYAEFDRRDTLKRSVEHSRNVAEQFEHQRSEMAKAAETPSASIETTPAATMDRKTIDELIQNITTSNASGLKISVANISPEMLNMIAVYKEGLNKEAESHNTDVRGFNRHIEQILRLLANMPEEVIVDTLCNKYVDLKVISREDVADIVHDFYLTYHNTTGEHSRSGIPERLHKEEVQRYKEERAENAKNEKEHINREKLLANTDIAYNEDHTILLAVAETVTSLNIEPGVYTIYEGACKGCTKLTNVTIPQSVSEIGNEAFMDCDLRSVEIPSSVNRLGKNIFANNKNLKDVVIYSEVASISRSAFSGCPNVIVRCVANSNVEHVLTPAKDPARDGSFGLGIQFTTFEPWEEFRQKFGSQLYLWFKDIKNTLADAKIRVAYRKYKDVSAGDELKNLDLNFLDYMAMSKTELIKFLDKQDNLIKKLKAL